MTDEISPARVLIARLMADGRERTTSDVARQTGLTVNSAGAHLGIMQTMGLINKIVGGKNSCTIWQYLANPNRRASICKSKADNAK